jgi:hypothetical protein
MLEYKRIVNTYTKRLVVTGVNHTPQLLSRALLVVPQTAFFAANVNDITTKPTEKFFPRKIC